ncbi:MAG: hypothetical protein Kow0047_19760 [Anaerolineae bacterium]
MCPDPQSPLSLAVSDELAAWLMDPADPSARFWAQTLACPGRPVGLDAQQAILSASPAREILQAQWPGGAWVSDRSGYTPRYRASFWQIVFLAELGAPTVDAIRRVCLFAISRWQQPDGRFSMGHGAHGATLCLNGALLYALAWFGLAELEPVERLAVALAFQVTHEALTCEYAPRGGCAARASGQGATADRIVCVHGACIAARGLLTAPSVSGREAALGQVRRLLAEADRWMPGAGDDPWWKLAFPLGLSSDVLEGMALARALEIHVPRRAVEWILDKRDDSGRWRLERTYAPVWRRFGEIGQPHRHVTLRALRALKAAGAAISWPRLME